MKKIFLVLFAATFVLSGCSKKTNNTTPPASTTSTTSTVNTAHPVPCFALALNQTIYELIGGSASVTAIASCSQNSFFYDWDFGDGSSHETTESVTHSYKKDGKYWIRLRVWNQDKSSSDSSKIQITVGERYLTKITINSINPINPNTGFTWDHGSTAGNINGVNDTIGPDLFVILGSDTANLLSTDTMDVAQVYNNVVTNAQGLITSTPVIWDFSKSTLPTFKNVKLTNYNNWIIQIMDKQYTSGGGGGSQHMISKSFNPVVSLGNTSPASITNGLYKVTFEWVIR